LTWVRLDDAFARHRKVRRLGHVAFRLHICALCWCSEHLTDGHIPRDELDDVCDLTVRELRQAVPELVRRGLWDEVDDGYRIHDYLDYNPSRAKVLDERAAKSARQARWRASRSRPAAAAAVDASVVASTDASRDALVTPAPSPPRPDPVGVGSGRAAKSPFVPRANGPVDNSRRALRVVRQPCPLPGHQTLDSGVCASCRAEQIAGAS
jgi:hypothetical protein